VVDLHLERGVVAGVVEAEHSAPQPDGAGVLPSAALSRKRQPLTAPSVPRRRPQVAFPADLDVFDFCSDDLKKQLEGPRLALKEWEDEQVRAVKRAGWVGGWRCGVRALGRLPSVQLMMGEISTPPFAPAQTLPSLTTALGPLGAAQGARTAVYMIR